MNKKTLDIKKYELPITITKENAGRFSAKCSIWEDCYAQGETIEEVINEISYVASSLIELYTEENLKIPLKLKSTKKNKGKSFSLKFPLVISAN